MPSNPSNDPICYRLGPDRRLLDGTCGVDGCPEHPAGPDGTPDVPPCLMGVQQHTVIGYDGITRLAMMVTPEEGGPFADQAWEAVSTVRAILRQQNEPMAVTVQTVFIDDAANVPAARRLMEAYYGDKMPLTLFVVQPPCDGRALAIEAWAISTRTAEVTCHSPQLVTVEHDGLRWIHATAGSVGDGNGPAYQQAGETLRKLDARLKGAGASFDEVARFWLYQGGITEVQDDIERYRELNRARTDFYDGVPFNARRLIADHDGSPVYPASTGIGMREHGLVLTCLALQTERDDVELLPLENPLQMSSFDYPEHYSKKSPKFARAMAVRMGDHVTTWVSGTASIVDCKTAHVGDVAKQTGQTLTNIERLIDEANFERMGWSGAGATLGDLAKIRVYVKHPEDYETCRAVCEARLGRIPAIYAVAEVCRPDLLVEIEGVAFSPLKKPLPSRSDRSKQECAPSETSS